MKNLHLPVTKRLAALALNLCLALPLAAQDGAVPDLMPVDISNIRTRDAKVEFVEIDGKKALKMTFGPAEKFANVFIEAPDNYWDLSKYGGVEAVISNPNAARTNIGMRVDEDKEKGKRAWNQNGARIDGDAKETIQIYFGQDYDKPGYEINSANIKEILFFKAKLDSESTLILHSLKPYGTAKMAVKMSELKGKTPESPVLYDFESENPSMKLANLDSKHEIIEHDGSKALKVELGHTRPYPNITITPDEPLNLEKFTRLEFDITNLSDESLKVGARVDNPNATGRSNSNSGSVSLDPGEKGTMVVEFDRYYADEIRNKLKGMHVTPWGKRGGMGGQINPAYVTRMNLFLNKPHRSYTFVIDNVRAAGSYEAKEIPEPFFPFVDQYGQYIHQDWPDKIKADSDLVAVREREAKSISEFPRPANWDKYGGWADGPKLDATGNFYTVKRDGQWYLVDPEGHLFFSLGIDVVKDTARTIIDQREGWFRDAPWKSGNPEMEKFVSTSKHISKGDFKNTQPRMFDFYQANLKKKYGENFRSKWEEITPKRLMNWGVNTIGNWSDPQLIKEAGIPYTHWVHYWPPSKLPGRKPVPDPFDDAFSDRVKQRAKAMTKGTVDDPYCIGYFVDNELSWGHETTLAESVLAADDGQAAKKALKADLEAKYGEITALNQAWGTEFASWEAFLTTKVTKVPAKAKEDLRAFNEKLVTTYFRKVSEVMKDVAPNKLYLGCRFAEHNPQVVRVAAEFCDVVSFNIYNGSVASWKPAYPIDKPVIIGEFHFGGTDRGVFGKGLQGTETTEKRASMYYDYITGAMTNPILVGAHWFQMIDEPVTGRNDGENHGIGFVSITDTPYQEMIDASRKAANALYTTRSESPQKLTAK